MPRADLTPAVAETPGLAGTPGYMQTAQTPDPGTPAFQPPATDWGTGVHSQMIEFIVSIFGVHGNEDLVRKGGSATLELPTALEQGQVQC